MKVEDPQKNRQMFDEIARGYDRANAFITFGRYKSWYRILVKMSGIKSGDRVLDCATGTGNVPIEFKRIIGDDLVTVGVDVSEKMLDIAKQKAEAAGYDIEFRIEDILDMSFPDNSFDAATITFGIRNTVSIEKTLEEMARVVRPGGKVLVLETGKTNGFMNSVYNVFQKIFVRPVGMFLTGHKDAYKWLTESSNDFPSGTDFVNIMNGTGRFGKTSFRRLMFGYIFLYVGEVK
jgi:demethylmenaquinone methyltransferase/2-methoxy-6-polyprenyl-1,4-benzoquinol methylase